MPEPINFQEFKALCKKGAIVRWYRSGVVERLEHDVENGCFVAICVITKRRHRIAVHKKDCILRQEWHVEEISKDLPVQVGLIYDAMRAKRSLILKGK